VKRGSGWDAGQRVNPGGVYRPEAAKSGGYPPSTGEGQGVRKSQRAHRPKYGAVEVVGVEVARAASKGS